MKGKKAGEQLRTNKEPGAVATGFVKPQGRVKCDRDAVVTLLVPCSFMAFSTRVRELNIGGLR